MLSITNTSKLLHISKFKLLKILQQENIVPTKAGNKKLLSEEQIQTLKNLLNRTKEQSNLFENFNDDESKNSSTFDKQDLMYQKVIDEKEKQIQYLQQQLEQEKRDRREIEQGIMSIQASMMRFQNMLEAPAVKQKGFFQRMFSRA
jgi:arginyl-tRNA--protein-N-Asp/Glu arginylyltransferase